MNYLNGIVSVTDLLQLLVGTYALRLTRVFGTSRVGWSLFGAFAILAVVHSIEALGVESVRHDIGVNLRWIYLFVSILLLIGLLHTEAVLWFQGRAERAEVRVREAAAALVEKGTASLTQANRDLTAEVKEHRHSEELLAAANQKFQTALASGKQLKGWLAICCQCKKIRDEAGRWTVLERFIAEHSEARFSHGLCPDCTGHFLDECKESFPDNPAKG